VRTRIKICGITRLEDALSAVEHGADALGFILWPKSARYIEPESLARIAREVPAFVSCVGVFVNPMQAEVDRLLDAWPAAALQFHGEESAAFCAASGRPWIKTARVRPGLDLVEFLTPYQGASAWLIDAFHEQLYGGTGSAFDWDLVPRKLARPLILSGGLSVANVGDAIAHLHPYAVDVSTGVEVDKGIKDPRKIADFIAAVRRADRGASIEQA
jgi:phosphoribosylanthranilate isomerase